mmetsp:Transcript_7631/g.11601  ORF Transcript_7631/g.11601 Transcript_7631/m.11601 type:complete len:107 (-) Transcript_7631:41-361(-)|eukprot:CAMPEP_0175092528 /NCGR_PEP_ID=MMETSP0086_2-20121207/2510_1 /TAXON_ID=136419 /ORGANISM="Unknown Unknown, Strain D1" /LENGTH=106 /DNA_ID=CAMNT_0016365395 /DNA_START=25 /DNA_END=345 /DNA_ORIENTATION=+
MSSTPTNKFSAEQTYQRGSYTPPKLYTPSGQENNPAAAVSPNSRIPIGLGYGKKHQYHSHYTMQKWEIKPPPQVSGVPAGLIPYASLSPTIEQRKAKDGAGRFDVI